MWWSDYKRVTQKMPGQVKPESFQPGLPDMVCQALQPNLFEPVAMSNVLKRSVIPLLFLEV